MENDEKPRNKANLALNVVQTHSRPRSTMRAERDPVALRLVSLPDPFNSTVESEAEDEPGPPPPENGPCQARDTDPERGQRGGEPEPDDGGAQR